MKYLLFLLYLSAFMAFGQPEIQVTFLDSSRIEVDRIIDVDNFETLYYLQGNIIYKK